MAKRKRSFLEKINPFDKESRETRRVRRGKKAGKKAAEATKDMVGFGSGEQSLQGPKYKPSRALKVGAKVGTKVRRGAVGVKKTKGGDYVKYGKKTASAGSFRSAFKKGCAGDAKGFSWDGRSYSCAKAYDKKKTVKKKVSTGPGTQGTRKLTTGSGSRGHQKMQD